MTGCKQELKGFFVTKNGSPCQRGEPSRCRVGIAHIRPLDQPSDKKKVVFCNNRYPEQSEDQIDLPLTARRRREGESFSAITAEREEMAISRTVKSEDNQSVNCACHSQVQGSSRAINEEVEEVTRVPETMHEMFKNPI